MTDKLDRVINGLALVLSEVQTPQYRGPSMNFYQQSGGQLQFSAAGPRYRDAEKSGPSDPGVAWSSKMGAVFVEAAPPHPTDEGKLDWNNQKIVFAMSDKDIGEIVWGLKTNKEEIRLVHAPDDDARNNNKTFRLKKEKEYRGEPQWSMSLTERKNGQDTRVSIFIKGPDVIRLQLLLESSLPVIMGNNKV